MLKKLQRLKTTLSHSTVNKALTNSFWLLVEKNVNLLVGLAINIFLARYLGPEQFGVMSYLIALVALMGPISSLGLNGILSREMVNQPDSEGKILATSLMFRLCSASLTLLLLTLIFWIHPSLTNHQLGLFLIFGST